MCRLCIVLGFAQVLTCQETVQELTDPAVREGAMPDVANFNYGHESQQLSKILSWVSDTDPLQPWFKVQLGLARTCYNFLVVLKEFADLGANPETRDKRDDSGTKFAGLLAAARMLTPAMDACQQVETNMPTETLAGFAEGLASLRLPCQALARRLSEDELMASAVSTKLVRMGAEMKEKVAKVSILTKGWHTDNETVEAWFWRDLLQGGSSQAGGGDNRHA